MKSLSSSLRALSHPITLLCIALLLLNDHVFNLLIPSWLTGKLSDFAGLFFFPFLFAALLAFIFRERLTNRQIGLFAFGITAVWFCLMKTTVAGNLFTEQFLSFVLQRRAQIIQDPTDVMALSVMVPGWVLWEQKENKRPPRWAWIVLLVAAFASMATGDPGPQHSVRVVISEGSTIYARGDGIYSASQDGGQTWQGDNQSIQWNYDVPTDTVLCQPLAASICYRVYPDQVQESKDGGATWTTAWQVPPSRRDYMERKSNCSITPFAPGPFGMTFAEPRDAQGIQTLVVALGSEGVLVHSPQGTWQQYPVQETLPMPDHARDWNDALCAISSERGDGVLFATFLFIAIGFLSWYFVARALAQAHRPSPKWRWVALPFIFSVIFLVASLAGLYLAIQLESGFPLWLTPITGSPFFSWFLLLLLPSGVLVGDIILARAAPRPQYIWLAILWSLLMVCGAYLAWLAPFALWAFGVIVLYSLAQAIAIIAFILWILSSGILLKRLCQFAANGQLAPNRVVSE